MYRYREGSGVDFVGIFYTSLHGAGSVDSIVTDRNLRTVHVARENA